MTVETLISDLQKWIEKGIISKDSEVVLTPDLLSFDESELFTATFHSMPQPEFDKDNPTKQALCISGLNRIPNDSFGEGSDKRYFYGTGFSVVELTDENKSEVEIRIALDKANHYNEWLEAENNKVKGKNEQGN